jgi:acyl-CoA thioesterase-1
MRQLLGPYGAHRRVVHAAAVAILMLLASQPALAADRLVLAFGDSLTAGYQLRPAESFPAQLEAALRKSGASVKVHNAGVSGDTTKGGRARLNWVLASLKEKPDLVILELGANDMLRGLPVAQARANLDAILTELKRRDIPVLIAGMRAAPNLGAPYRSAFDAMYPALARKYDAPLYPFFMEGVAANPGMQLKDKLHPSARGVTRIVQGILPQVKAALGRG